MVEMLVMLLIWGVTQSASAQEKPKADKTKTVADKWRPLEGTYAEPGTEFNFRCGEYGDIQINLAENAFSGSEVFCKVVKLTDNAPASIKLDAICRDAQDDAKPRKEIILLKKIDEKIIFVRATQDGKFSDPGYRIVYCPEEQQRMYEEGKKADKADKERKEQQR